MATEGTAPTSVNFNYSAKPPAEIRLGDHNSDKAKIWSDWLEEFQWYKIASDLEKLPGEKQVAILMNCLGSEIRDIYKSFNLTAQEKKEPEVIISKLSATFQPKLNTTFTTFEFFKITQQEDETFNEFHTRLQLAAKQCKFNDVIENMSCEDRLIRDKIVLGIRSDEVRRALLSDPKLTLSKAVDTCRSSESISLQSKLLMQKENIQCDAVRGSCSDSKCRRCDTRHKYGWKNCPSRNWKCEKCGLKGHKTERCFSKNNSKNTFQKSANLVEAVNEIEDYYDLHINTIGKVNNDTEDWYETAVIEGQKVNFKLDTGAQCNIIPMSIANKIPQTEIKPSLVKYIVSFNGGKSAVIGKCALKCEFQKVTALVQFQVVDFDSCPVLGKRTCTHLGFIRRVESIERNYSKMYEGLGCLKNFLYKLDFIKDPVFEIKPSRQIPYKIRKVVKDELDKMVKLGVIKKQDQPTPVVSNMVVVTKNQKIRVCLDPTDVNKSILRRHFPLRTIEEISANIANSKWFTILDCKKGFWQVEVHPDSQKFLTFATPWGRYSYQRLPFGLSTAPEIFQCQITQVLDGIQNVEVSMDDILIHAPTQEQLNQDTMLVLQKLDNAGLKLNKDKCIFNTNKVKFLGHLMTENGLLPDPQKIEDIQNIRSPKDKKALQRFLGSVNYLRKFIDNLSSMTSTITSLLEKDVVYRWETEHEAAFQKIKEKLKELPLLKFYDVNKENVLSADCSSHAMGAVLFQDGYPIAYASKSLSPAQRNYPQIEKEALALRFACEKFHPYIYGKQLTMETDHKPLESIFKKSLDKAPPRLKRLILDVQPYNPTVIYKKGSSIPIPDMLSRDIIVHEEVMEDSTQNQLEVHLANNISVQASKEIQSAISNDSGLQELITTINNGWPRESKLLSPVVKVFWNFREELSVYEGLIWKGDRILYQNLCVKA